MIPQEAENAATSKLTGSALPDGALRLLEKESIETTSAMLKALYPNTALGKVEVLLWAGDYSGEKGAALRQQTGKALEKDGFAWKETLSDQKVEGRDIFLSSATRQNRRVRGLWLASADGAMLVWGEESDGGEAAFENVIYTAPKGWTVQVAADSVTLTPADLLPEEKLFVVLLPGRAYQGKLAEDAGALWTDACKAFGVTGSQPSEAVGVRRSFKGWTYFKYEGNVRKDDNDLFLSDHKVASPPGKTMDGRSTAPDPRAEAARL